MTTIDLESPFQWPSAQAETSWADQWLEQAEPEDATPGEMDTGDVRQEEATQDEVPPAWAKSFLTPRSISIDGTRRGVFMTAAGVSPASDKIPLLAASYELVSPRDPASGLSAGKLRFQPVVVTLPVGTVSPVIFDAMVTNEELKWVVLEFANPRSGGPAAVTHQIKLTKANVVAIRQRFETPPGGRSPAYLEDVAFTYATIEVTSQPGGNTAIAQQQRAAP